MPQSYFRNAPKYAVTTGGLPDGGKGIQRAHPCIVPPFTRNTAPQWPAAPTVNDSFASWGPAIPPNSVRRFPVIMDMDYSFKLLGIKYVTLIKREDDNIISYDGYWQSLGHNNSVPFMDVNYSYPWSGMPMNRYITVKLYVRSMGEHTLFGENKNRVTGQEIPLCITSNQGNIYGPGQVRTEYLINRGGSVEFEFHNRYDDYVKVHFAMYGMKVRI